MLELSRSRYEGRVSHLAGNNQVYSFENINFNEDRSV